MLGHFTPGPPAENGSLSHPPCCRAIRSRPVRHTSATGIQICEVCFCVRSFCRRRRSWRGNEPLLMKGSRLLGKDLLASLISAYMYWLSRTFGVGSRAAASATLASSCTAALLGGGSAGPPWDAMLIAVAAVATPSTAAPAPRMSRARRRRGPRGPRSEEHTSELQSQ